MKNILYLSVMLVASALISHDAVAQVAKKDSLNRELTLERDFVPTQDQVQKSFFSPLATKKSSPLAPLRFVNDSYSIGAKIEHRVFDPIYNDRAPESLDQKGFVRVYGGFPGVLGLNVGGNFTNGKDSQFDLSLNHFTRKYLGRNTLPAPLKTLRTHDTDFTLGYARKLALSTLRVRGHFFYDIEALYGSHNGQPAALLLESYDFKPPYPLINNYGAILSGERTYAPISVGSNWYASTFGTFSYVGKNDPTLVKNDPDPLYSGGERMLTSELRLANRSTLAYEISDLWKFDVGAEIDLRNYPKLVVKYPIKNLLILGLRPSVSYKGDHFEMHVGGRVQYANRASSSLVLSPDASFRFRPIDIFSLFAKVDGGTAAMDLREVYKYNKYFFGPSIANATETSKYRVIAGVELGNLSGLSVTLQGGYVDYRDFVDWEQRKLITDLDGSITLPLFVYDLRHRDNVKKTYGNISARYVSQAGLRLSASAQYNRYITSDMTDKEDKPLTVLGLPKLEVRASAVYDINSRMSLQASYTGLFGMAFEDVDEPGKYVHTTVNELSAEFSYRLSRRVGLSVIGTNLLNLRNVRWRHYEQRGSGILGTATITF